MKHFLAPLFILACGLGLLSGCSSSSKIIGVGLRPEITSIERHSDGTTTVSWQIVNTNIVPYLLSRVDHKIFLNGTLVGTMRSENAIAIPANTAAGGTNALKLENAGANALQAAVGAATPYRVDTNIIIQIYGDTTEKSALQNAGSVTVVNK